VAKGLKREKKMLKPVIMESFFVFHLSSKENQIAEKERRIA